MVRIISVGSSNPIKSLWRKFNSLDFFTKLAIVTLILLAIATPSIVNNYQLFNVHGESEVQRLRTIAQLQQSQAELQNAFAKSSTIPARTTGATLSNPAGGFNLVDSLQRIIIRILQIFN